MNAQRRLCRPVVTSAPFGVTADGRAVTAYRIRNSAGAYVEVLDLGGILRAVCVPDRTGRLTDVCLGYDTVAAYERDDAYLGALIGRYANRIENAAFTLGGRVYPLEKNDGENHLHGGSNGFHRQLWEARAGDISVTLSRLSPDGEAGYPGNLDVSVTYTFDDDNRLVITYYADTDADTIVNLTNHAYWNLAGTGTVLGHTLHLEADAFLAANAACLPTGELLPVAGTPFDFRRETTLGENIGRDDPQLQNGGGYDHCYVLGSPGVSRTFARLCAPESGVCMEVETDQPGVQLYTANGLTRRSGKGGAVYGPRCAVCLETQHYPASPSHPDFPSTRLNANGTFRSETVCAFSVLA